jgi:hypothetical protein
VYRDLHLTFSELLASCAAANKSAKATRFECLLCPLTASVPFARTPVTEVVLAGSVDDTRAATGARGTPGVAASDEFAQAVRESVLDGTITEEEFRHIVAGHRQLEQDMSPPALTLRDVFDGLGLAIFAALVDSILLGNQCVVICDDAGSSQSLLNALAALVPPLCATVVYSSPMYIEAFRTRFLGLTPGVKIPHRKLDPASYCVVRLQVLATVGKGWEGWTFALLHPAHSLDGRADALRSSYTRVLCEHLQSVQPPECDARFLDMLKDRWVRIAAAFFTLTHQEEGVCFESVEMLLHAFGLVLSDVATIRFFTTALTGAPRKHLLGLIAATHTAPH